MRASVRLLVATHTADWPPTTGRRSRRASAPTSVPSRAPTPTPRRPTDLPHTAHQRTPRGTQTGRPPAELGTGQWYVISDHQAMGIRLCQSVWAGGHWSVDGERSATRGQPSGQRAVISGQQSTISGQQDSGDSGWSDRQHATVETSHHHPSSPSHPSVLIAAPRGRPILTDSVKQPAVSEAGLRALWKEMFIE